MVAIYEVHSIIFREKMKKSTKTEKDDWSAVRHLKTRPPVEESRSLPAETRCSLNSFLLQS
jgi:hypothetical protein